MAVALRDKCVCTASILNGIAFNAYICRMARGKMEKRSEFDQFPNCVNEDTSHAGHWQSFFAQPQPLVLEVGCGKGDLALGYAQLHPECNVLGVDEKAVRMWVGASKAIELGLGNMGFLRCDAHQLDQYFAEGEVRDIWITFPDPFPKKRQTRNRLTERHFLYHYLKLMDGKGRVFFKTDNDALFDWTLRHLEQINRDGDLAIEVHAQTTDLHHSEIRTPEAALITDYEQRFLDMGQLINYVCFSLAKGPKFGEKILTEKEGLEGSTKAPRRIS